MSFVDKAAEFAQEAHEGQVRKGSGFPYVTHCFDVLKRLETYGVKREDEAIQAAALLHDVIEDTDFTKEILAIEFGLDVAQIVSHCSRPYSMSSRKQKLEWLSGFDDKRIEAVIIKIADRYCNVTDYLAAGKIRYALWYNLQAYPLYETYFKREQEVPEEWRSGIRGDIYAYNQKMQKILGRSFLYLEVNGDEFLKFERKDIDKLLIKGVR